MVGLSGSFASSEIAPLAAFLSAMRKTGDLLLVDGELQGTLSFNAGQLVAVTVGNERGCAALEVVLGALRHARVEFFERQTPVSPDLDLGPNALGLLESLAAAPALEWPDRSMLPRVVATPDLNQPDVTLSRSELQLLVQIDGIRDVAALSAAFGLVRTLRELRNLGVYGLIEFTTPNSPAVGPAPAPLSEMSHPRKARVVWEVLQALVCTALVVLCVRTFVLNFKVDGISMQPGFQAGQVLLVNRAAYFHLDWLGRSGFLFGGPRRGDVAVFDSPVQPGTDYIKRIVGLPGDRVAIHDGAVYVNDVALVEPYIREPADYRFPESGVARVPADSYFVLGDNRPESLDSHFGWFVPVDDLIGRAWLRYWPPDALGLVPSG